MGRTVGIDLGTTYSLIAFVDPATGQPKCIPGPHGETLCPSVVSVDAEGSIVVGAAARHRLVTQPERTIYSVKDRKSTRLNSSHIQKSRMPSSA